MDTESIQFNKQNPLICIVGLGGLGCEVDFFKNNKL